MPLIQTNVSGNEVWQAAQGPGGPGEFLNINGVSNRRQGAIITGAGAATTVMTQSQSALMWDGAAPTTWAITLPFPAYDGQVVTIGTETTLTALVTVTAAVGHTLNATYASQTLTAVTSIQFQFFGATLTWYRLR